MKVADPAQTRRLPGRRRRQRLLLHPRAAGSSSQRPSNRSQLSGQYPSKVFRYSKSFHCQVSAAYLLLPQLFPVQQSYATGSDGLAGATGVLNKAASACRLRVSPEMTTPRIWSQRRNCAAASAKSPVFTYRSSVDCARLAQPKLNTKSTIASNWFWLMFAVTSLFTQVTDPAMSLSRNAFA